MSKPLTQFLSAFKKHLDLTVETRWGDPDEGYFDPDEENSIEDANKYIHDIMTQVMDEIPFPLNYTINNGASKIVIVFKQFDWVVKIPFTGQWTHSQHYYPYTQREFLLEFPDSTIDDYYHERDQWYEENPGYDEFCYFTGGGHKNRDEEYINEWDYCDTEVDCYNQAEKDGYGDVFLKCKYVGRAKNGYPVYIQKKGNTFYDVDELEKPSHNSIMNAATISKDLRLPFKDTWIACCIELYGIEKAKSILKYLKEKHYIDDMHPANYGFDNKNRPVLIDYSNFCG